MEYLLKYDILTELVHLSVDDRPKGVKGETIRTLTNLIILLDEKFLSRQAVNKPISQLIQLCLDEDAARFQLDDESFDASAAVKAAEEDYEEDLVDLMCHIASRIRNTPDLLQIFFSDEPVNDADNEEGSRSLRDGSIIVSRDVFDEMVSSKDQLETSNPKLSEAESEERSSSPTPSVDSTATIQPSTAYSSRKQSKRRLRFPLFSYLLKFVHREGRIGELARAGLLFLISLEAVQPSPSKKKAPKKVSFGTEDIRRSLAVFIAHSDFADVLGAGLGAAYGLLPSRIKPVPRYDPTAVESGKGAITLASTTASDTEALANATQSDDSELQSQLRLLVDLIEFCQDVLDSLWLTSRLSSPSDTDEKSSPPSPPAVKEHDLDPMIRKLAQAIAIAIRDTFIRNVVYPSLMESSDVDGSSAAVLNYLDVIVIVLRSGHILTDVVMDFLLPSDQEGEGNGYEILAADEADRYSVKDLILDSMEEGKRASTRVGALRLARSLVVCHGFRTMGGLMQVPPVRSDTVPVDEWMQEGEGVEGAKKVAQHFGEIDSLSSLLTRLSSTTSLPSSLSNYLLDAESSLRHDSTFAPSLILPFPSQIPLSPDSFIQHLFSNFALWFASPVEVNLAASGVIAALASCPIRSLDGWLTGKAPALVELLSGLVDQVESYRMAVEDFDKYLEERRRSLVLSEDLEDALAPPYTATDEGEEGSVGACLTLPNLRTQGRNLQNQESVRAAQRDFGILSDTRSTLAPLTPTPPPSTPTPAPQQTQPSALARLFGGRPTRPPPNLPTRPGAERTVSASTLNPYAEHFRETAAVMVRTQTARGGEGWRLAPKATEEKGGRVSLSSVLDNTILLEELVKELLAVILVRRTWGVDAVSFM